MTGGKSYTGPAPKYVERGLLNCRFPYFPVRSADMFAFSPTTTKVHVRKTVRPYRSNTHTYGNLCPSWL